MAKYGFSFKPVLKRVSHRMKTGIFLLFFSDAKARKKRGANQLASFRYWYRAHIGYGLGSTMNKNYFLLFMLGLSG